MSTTHTFVVKSRRRSGYKRGPFGMSQFSPTRLRCIIPIHCRLSCITLRSHTAVHVVIRHGIQQPNSLMRRRRLSKNLIADEIYIVSRLSSRCTHRLHHLSQRPIAREYPRQIDKEHWSSINPQIIGMVEIAFGNMGDIRCDTVER